MGTSSRSKPSRTSRAGHPDRVAPVIATFRRVVDWLAGSRLRFAVVCAAALVLAYNLPFWHASLQAVGGATPAGVAFLAALAAILVAVHALLLLLVPGRRLPAVIVAALLVAASVVLYYEATFNVYFDSVMVRNVFETDSAEVRDVLSLRLAEYVIALGVVPLVVLARVRLPPERVRARIVTLLATFLAATLLTSALSFAFSAQLASYLREHKPVRYLVNPLNFVYGAMSYAFGQEQGANRPFEYQEGEVERLAAARGERPLLVMLVLGETARAANFSLGGYARATNPQLGQLDHLVWFSDVSSCGTSTATSVPCMFSHAGREDFDVDLASSRSNLLDAVARGQFAVEWWDNNSGCKHVCDRVTELDFRASPLRDRCEGGHCFDEAVTASLQDDLAADARDRFIVIHQAGSHGPAYYERYPAAFEKFTPDCRTGELSHCSREEIVNAYDNSILYTDYVVAQQVALLESMQDRYDSLLIYVSDHGESLGENGVYLHAAPYFMAPAEQTHVPMLLWASSRYRARAQLDEDCMRKRAAEPATHDAVYHTVLGALGLRSDLYRPELDLLAGCRKGW